MSDDGPTDVDAAREQLAEGFGRDLDPLAQHADTFAESDVDPFALFIAEVLEPQGLREKTIDGYRITFRQWREYMDDRGRHPACPNESHVKGFVEHLRAEDGRGNTTATVRNKVNRLRRAYEYWQAEAPFPHPQDYNPVDTAIEKIDLDDTEEREHPRLALEDLRDALADVTDYRERAILAVQLKLGLRLGELRNMQLKDVHIQNAELRRHYPNLGTNPRLEDRENAVYVPPRDERDGNKSENPRVLPLDDELRRLLLRYLLVRPDNGEPWVFLTLKTHGKITDHETVNDIWRGAFDTEGVTSHYGRHFFTTYWAVEQDLGTNDPRLAYMRGDAHNSGVSASIPTYIHTYYEDVEDMYREEIFKLQL